jgi:hypothetical protein
MAFFEPDIAFVCCIAGRASQAQVEEKDDELMMVEVKLYTASPMGGSDKDASEDLDKIKLQACGKMCQGRRNSSPQMARTCG